MKIHLSKMSGKLAGFFSINTNPLTNSFCQKMSQCDSNICSKCYSLSMLATYRKTCVPAFQRNSDILSAGIIPEGDLPDYKKYGKIRINSHGELINDTHYINICNLARKNPGVIFSLYTKRKDIVTKYITGDNQNKPENIIYIYSNPKINPTDQSVPEGFDKTFSVFTKEYAEENEVKINCGGKSCAGCMLCYTHNDVGKINELIK